MFFEILDENPSFSERNFMQGSLNSSYNVLAKILVYDSKFTQMRFQILLIKGKNVKNVRLLFTGNMICGKFGLEIGIVITPSPSEHR